jgi:hypothetical protein
MTTPPTDDPLQTLQHEVQRLLGCCLLQLQQYERLFKTIVAHHKIAVPAHNTELINPESILTERVANTNSKTLGTLVGQFIGSCAVPHEGDTPAEVSESAPENDNSIELLMQISFSAEDYVRTEKDLKELVSLRNNLVHHFINQHDLQNLDGCRGAHDALITAYSRINQRFEQLRGWAKQMDQTRQMMVKHVQSDAFYDFRVNGIAPDSSVNWPLSGIVQALQEAAGKLAVEGWTPVAKAERWIIERHPEQLPAKYGCRSWRQVVHESRLFDLQYREVDGQLAACYRPKKA